MTYKLLKDDGGEALNMVLKKDTNSYIPFDDANTDYQAYKEWLKIDGNVPEEAD
tara:strand:- start:230 stop:391 length:162 start_codon:yes stop_codon:yes gene_type:complete